MTFPRGRLVVVDRVDDFPSALRRFEERFEAWKQQDPRDPYEWKRLKADKRDLAKQLIRWKRRNAKRESRTPAGELHALQDTHLLAKRIGSPHKHPFIGHVRPSSSFLSGRMTVEKPTIRRGATSWYQECQLRRRFQDDLQEESDSDLEDFYIENNVIRGYSPSKNKKKKFNWKRFAEKKADHQKDLQKNADHHKDHHKNNDVIIDDQILIQKDGQKDRASSSNNTIPGSATDTIGTKGVYTDSKSFTDPKTGRKYFLRGGEGGENNTTPGRINTFGNKVVHIENPKYIEAMQSDEHQENNKKKKCLHHTKTMVMETREPYDPKKASDYEKLLIGIQVKEGWQEELLADGSRPKMQRPKSAPQFRGDHMNQLVNVKQPSGTVAEEKWRKDGSRNLQEVKGGVARSRFYTAQEWASSGKAGTKDGKTGDIANNNSASSSKDRATSANRPTMSAKDWDNAVKTENKSFRNVKTAHDLVNKATEGILKYSQVHSEHSVHAAVYFAGSNNKDLCEECGHS